jgi:hypothetical protein
VSERRDEMEQETAGQAAVGATAVAVAGVEEVERFRELFDAVNGLDAHLRTRRKANRRLIAHTMLAMSQRRDELASAALKAAPVLLALYDERHTGDPQGSPPKDGSPAPLAPEREEA